MVVGGCCLLVVCGLAFCLVGCCSLFVRCMLFVSNGPSVVVGCVLCDACCVLLVFLFRLVLIDCRVLLVVDRLLFVDCVLFVVFVCLYVCCCALFVVGCLLFVVCRSLSWFVVCWLLLFLGC